MILLKRRKFVSLESTNSNSYRIEGTIFQMILNIFPVPNPASNHNMGIGNEPRRHRVFRPHAEGPSPSGARRSSVEADPSFETQQPNPPSNSNTQANRFNKLETANGVTEILGVELKRAEQTIAKVKGGKDEELTKNTAVKNGQVMVKRNAGKRPAYEPLWGSSGEVPMNDAAREVARLGALTAEDEMEDEGGDIRSTKRRKSNMR